MPCSSTRYPGQNASPRVHLFLLFSTQTALPFVTELLLPHVMSGENWGTWLAMAIHQCFWEESSRGHWAAALVVQELLLLRKSRTINHLIFAFPSEIYWNQTLSPHVTTMRGVECKQIPVFTILIDLYMNIGAMPVAESEAEQSSRHLGYHLSYKAIFNLTSPSTCFSHDFYALFAMVGGRLLICQ